LEEISAAHLSRVALVSLAMPRRLRPKTDLAEQAILVGDPGRSLLLAQELLVEPKMSNHARGLWGYTGQTLAGEELTIQATGMGGPSAALVLADLAKLGVKRVVRVGTCTGLGRQARCGELLLPVKAVAVGGSAVSFGVESGAATKPDAELLGRLREELEAGGREVAVASLDTLPSSVEGPAGVDTADMQTVAVFARGRELGLAAAAVLIVNEAGGDVLADDDLETVEKQAGRIAARALSNPKVEG
jgi:uridine phosphorylase